MKNPLMMSRTSVCAPKPTARPAMPAPVRHGRDVHPEFVQHHQHGEAADRDGRDIADERAEGARALGPLERVEGRSLADFVLEAAHQKTSSYGSP